MKSVLALVGMAGSGKSLVADELVRRGFGYVRFGQITLDLMEERGLALNEANERAIREEVRSQHGMAAYALLNLPKIEQLLKAGHVVADGLYSWSEYKVLKKHFGDRLVIIAVYAPPQLRYERLTQRRLQHSDQERRNRPLTAEQAQTRDAAEIENLEKGGPIAMADYTLVNTGTVAELLEQLQTVLTTRLEDAKVTSIG